MNESEQIPEVQSFSKRAIIIASSVCFASSICFYWIARPAVSQLQVLWMELLVYAIIPISVTFIVLYRSYWHREITGVARTCSLLLLSCIILAGEIIAIVILLCLLAIFIGLLVFCVNAFNGQNLT
jgi:hypothetical protein